MNYYLGIDIGTTSVKAVAFAADGGILAHYNTGYPIQHPQTGWSEQDPEEIFEAVINSIHNITTTLSGYHPVLVSFSAAMHSLIAIDHNGNLLSNCIIWADNRAGDIANELKQNGEAQFFYSKTGVPVHAMSPFCKILWFKKNLPDVFNNSARFISIKEYVCYKLFRKYIVDTGIASTTGLLNIHNLQWDDEILQYAGIQKQQLSEVVATTHIEILSTVPEKRLNALHNTAFVIGSSDGALANLGSGAAQDGDVVVTIGTSNAIRWTSSNVFLDKEMRTFCYHLCHNKYIVGGAGNNGAVVLQWLKEKIFRSGQSFENFLKEVTDIPPGSEELIFIPYILGERAPIWNSEAKGVFFGLSITHQQPHLVRASMEGIVYSIYSMGKVLAEQKKSTLIHVTGGFTQSKLWLQILSDMFNCKVAVPASTEGAAWGAVLLGMDALQLPREWKNTNHTEFYQPGEQQHQLYKKQFAKFERLYNLLKGEMK